MIFYSGNEVTQKIQNEAGAEYTCTDGTSIGRGGVNRLDNATSDENSYKTTYIKSQRLGFTEATAGVQIRLIKTLLFRKVRKFQALPALHLLQS